MIRVLTAQHTANPASSRLEAGDGESHWEWSLVEIRHNALYRLTFTCSNSAIEALEEGMKYVQS